MTASVTRDQRHTKAHRCPICDGADGDPRGKGKRCSGFTSADGEYVHCSRDEYAGGIDGNGAGLYAHRMRGSCRCGQTHGTDSVIRLVDTIEATYDYRDELGTLLFQVVRKSGKKFFQRRPDGAGGWILKLDDTRRVLYRLPDLIEDDVDRTVHIVEGEKDADTLISRGFLATCNPAGAGKWSAVADHARDVLQGRDVIVIADRDDVGRKHALDVTDSLRGSVRSITTLECPAPHKDVSDLLSAGRVLTELVPIGSEREPPEERQAVVSLEILPFDDIFTPEPEAKLVVPAFGIAPGPVNMVVGKWATAKSITVCSLGVSIASGEPAWGVFRVVQGSWLHLDLEMGRRGIKRYVSRLIAGMVPDRETLRGRVNIAIKPRLDFLSMTADDFARIFDGYGIVTIDPFRRVSRGLEENSSEVRDVLDTIADGSELAQVPVVMLHHAGKTDTTGKRPRGELGRGSSAIDDAVQTKLVLTRDEKDGDIFVTHEKTRELPKCVDDFGLRIVDVEVNGDPRGGLRVEHLDREQMNVSKTEAGNATALIEKVVQIIATNPGCSSRTLRAECKGARGTDVDAAAELAERAGRIANSGSDKRTKWVLQGSPA